MAIEELITVVSPPEEPVEAGSKRTWAAVQKATGIKMPDDFRDFGIRYGSGSLCRGFLKVRNPFSPSFRDFVVRETDRLHVHRTDGYIEIPYGIFPERPGLLAWAQDENGNRLYWLTEGKPNNWPTIARSHEYEFERFEMSMTTFLARALMNEVRLPNMWGEPFTEAQRVFTPEA